MNPWEMEKWRGKHISNETRKGVYMRSDAGVDEDVRGPASDFCNGCAEITSFRSALLFI